jgi:hypothetical protein
MYFIDLLINAGLETLYFTGAIILAGLLLGVMQTMATRNFCSSLGNNTVMVTGIIGTPVHEISHALVAVLFGHRIKAVKLIQRPDQNGVMGYVQHTYNTRNLYQQLGNFFIGVAPIFGGLLAIMGLMFFLVPQVWASFMSIVTQSMTIQTVGVDTITTILTAYLELVKMLFSWENLKSPQFYVFLFLAVAIASHISLSPADMKGSLKGLIVIFIVLMILNAIGLSQSILAIDMIHYNLIITSFLMIAVIFSFITLVISLIVRLAFRH